MRTCTYDGASNAAKHVGTSGQPGAVRIWSDLVGGRLDAGMVPTNVQPPLVCGARSCTARDDLKWDAGLGRDKPNNPGFICVRAVQAVRGVRPVRSPTIGKMVRPRTWGVHSYRRHSARSCPHNRVRLDTDDRSETLLDHVVGFLCRLGVRCS